MYGSARFTRNAQRVICFSLAVAIVAAGLSLWTHKAARAHSGYTVTITQLA